MNLTSISSKGQIVIPKEIRDLLGISPSDTFRVYSKDENIIVSPVSKTEEVFGMFKANKPITKSDIKTSYKKAVARKQ